MFARNRSLLAITGVCALGLGLLPNAADARPAHQTGPTTRWTAPTRHAVFPTEPVAQTLHGTIHHLGTLGGTFSRVRDVNGQIVVGSAEVGDGTSHAFAYDLAAANPTMLDLGTLGGRGSEAVAVSGHVVAGEAETATLDGGHAFVYDLAATNPHLIDLGTLGGPISVPTDVDDGVVVGWSSLDAANEVVHAFAYDLNAESPRMVDLGSLGGTSVATAIDRRVVVGQSETSPGNDSRNVFAYDLTAPDPQMEDLGSGGGGDAFPSALDGTLIAGAFRLGPHSSRFHAFVSDLGTPGAPFRDLGDLAGGRGRSSAEAVNGRVVVGSATRGGLPRWSFAQDLSAPHSVMGSLGSLGGHIQDTAQDVDGNTVVGNSDMVATHNQHAFAYDLGAATPRMSDLGPAFAEQTGTIHVSGNVVAASQPYSIGTRAVVWTLDTTTAPALRFTKTKTFVRENVGHATVTVVRDGDTSAAVTVKYATRDIEGATSGRDFMPTRGTLSFGAGKTKATFRVPIVNDKRREGRERFLVRLLDPSAGAIQGTPRVAAVVILPSDR